MKALLLVAAILSAAVDVFAQGTVAFANTSTTLITTNNGPGGGSISGNTGAYHYELMVAPLGTFDRYLFIPIASATNSPSVAGRIFGGTVTNTMVGPGGGFALYVRGWLADGPDVDSYNKATFYGETYTVLQLAASGNPTTIPPGTPASIFGPGLLQGFFIGLIPEPSSIALSLLGLGVIALFRRKRWPAEIDGE
jgi:hypothetical protein